MVLQVVRLVPTRLLEGTVFQVVLLRALGPSAARPLDPKSKSCKHLADDAIVQPGIPGTTHVAAPWMKAEYCRPMDSGRGDRTKTGSSTPSEKAALLVDGLSDLRKGGSSGRVEHLLQRLP